MSSEFVLFFGFSVILGYFVFWSCLHLGLRWGFYPKRIREFYDDQWKAHVPLSGGLGFLLIGLLLYLRFRHPALLIALLSGLVGLADDVTKTLRQGHGMKARYKILLLVLVSLCFFSFGYGATRVAWSFIVLLATTSATNFTDGADGLLGSVLVPVFLVLPQSGVTGALLGSLISYLFFNASPARLFMGDTGSLFFGGFLASFMLLRGQEWWLILLCLIGVIEVASVVMQVIYFRLTGGKRIFRMTPIHHHFQKLGWSDPRIVTLFTGIQAVACTLCWVGWNWPW